MQRARMGYFRSVAINACQCRRELAARRAAELAVDAAQVVLDRLRAEVELRRGLSGRQARGELEGDLQLARRQLVERARIALARRLSRCRELEARALGPGLGAQPAECRVGVAQVRARVAAAADASQA